jgi:predicted Fe-Mo cluster-binding NifX family protein
LPGRGRFFEQENGLMKIAIPVAEGQLCMHFGHCEQFALVEVDATSRKVVGVDYVTPPPHAPGVLPPWLAEQGVEMIIAGGMGQRAQQLFAAHGVRVVVGAPAGTPEEIAQALLDETLETGQNVCDH